MLLAHRWVMGLKEIIHYKSETWKSYPWRSRAQSHLHIWPLLQTCLSSSVFQGNQTRTRLAHKICTQTEVEALILSPEPGLWIVLRRFQSLPHWKIQQITPVVLNQTALQDPSQVCWIWISFLNQSILPPSWLLSSLTVVFHTLQPVTQLSVHSLITHPITFLCCNWHYVL